MLIISRTPVRVSFFGGGTDYPGYYLRKRGAVLGVTLNKYTHVSVNTPGNYFDHRIRIGYSKSEFVNCLEDIEHPSIRECLKFKNFDGNLDIHIFSDLPAKTGLGSSSSFTVGFLNVLYKLSRENISKLQLAEQACYVEQSLICENVGSQDQFHAAFGGLNVIEFNQVSTQIRPVVISQSKMRILESHLLLFYTGLTRFASEVLQEQIGRTDRGINDEFLDRMVGMVYEAEKIMQTEEESNMALSIGKLLDESWTLKKQLSSKISSSIIDQAYEAAKKAGAYGGKLCGAGSGGFLALIVPPGAQEAVKSVLHPFLSIPVTFENEGSTIIYAKE